MIIHGSRYQFGRCAFGCESEEVMEINFNGVKVRLCNDHAKILVDELLTTTAPVKTQNERM